MKIILSRSGGGKTTKVAELMAELSHEGEESLIITNELNVSEFKEYAIRAEANLDKLRYAYAHTLGDVIKAVENKEDENVKVMFIDFGFSVSDLDLIYGEHYEKLLSTLQNAEIENGKQIYITMQSNRHLSEEKITVFDYEPETEI